MKTTNLEKILTNAEEAAIIFTENLKSKMKVAQNEEHDKNIRDDIRVLWQLTSTIRSLTDILEDKEQKPPLKVNNTYISNGGFGYMD